ncbi:MAG TPA: hypothetical protein VF546_03550 [Pyrinomonadaceae bacterium]|jgi:hypothetical protein
MPKQHETDEPAACLTDEGRAETGAHDYDPRARMQDDPAPSAGGPLSVAHGRPVSQAEYERQKERAGDAPAPSDAPAQEDPSTR